MEKEDKKIIDRNLNAIKVLLYEGHIHYSSLNTILLEGLFNIKNKTNFLNK